jgi:uncharacterized membrane protein
VGPASLLVIWRPLAVPRPGSPQSCGRSRRSRKDYEVATRRSFVISGRYPAIVWMIVCVMWTVILIGRMIAAIMWTITLIVRMIKTIAQMIGA